MEVIKAERGNCARLFPPPVLSSGGASSNAVRAPASVGSVRDPVFFIFFGSWLPRIPHHLKSCAILTFTVFRLLLLWLAGRRGMSAPEKAPSPPGFASPPLAVGLDTRIRWFWCIWSAVGNRLSCIR